MILEQYKFSKVEPVASIPFLPCLILLQRQQPALLFAKRPLWLFFQSFYPSACGITRHFSVIGVRNSSHRLWTRLGQLLLCNWGRVAMIQPCSTVVPLVDETKQVGVIFQECGQVRVRGFNKLPRLVLGGAE